MKHWMNRHLLPSIYLHLVRCLPSFLRLSIPIDSRSDMSAPTVASVGTQVGSMFLLFVLENM